MCVGWGGWGGVGGGWAWPHCGYYSVRCNLHLPSNVCRIVTVAPDVDATRTWWQALQLLVCCEHGLTPSDLHYAA